MAFRVEDGRAVITDLENTKEGLQEFFSALGMEERISTSILASVEECFALNSEPSADELQRCIMESFQNAQVGRVLCAGACLFFAGMAVGAMATAYLTSR